MLKPSTIILFCSFLFASFIVASSSIAQAPKNTLTLDNKSGQAALARPIQGIQGITLDELLEGLAEGLLLAKVL